MVELKNVLSLLPILLAMGAWIDFDTRGRRIDYFLALGLFFGALLCKLTVVFFPFIILLYAWWRRGRVGWGDLRATAPFFALSLALGLVSIWTGIWDREFTQTQAHVLPGGGPVERLLLIGGEIAFYLAKSFVPISLIPIYPRWEIDPFSPIPYLAWLALGLGAWYLWTKRETWGRHALLGVGFFLINLAPCPGFIPAPNMDFTWVMDHFLYLPIIGLTALVVAAVESLAPQLSPAGRIGGATVAIIALALLALESRFTPRSTSIRKRFGLTRSRAIRERGPPMAISASFTFTPVGFPRPRLTSICRKAGIRLLHGAQQPGDDRDRDGARV